MKKMKLEDYQKPCFQLLEVKLSFDLYETETVVKNRMSFVDFIGGEIILNGQNLQLGDVLVNGESWSDYQIEGELLTVKGLPKNPVIEIRNTINPSTNTSLDGLYMSGGRMFTQNEPQGFRRITYFPDRPDVMSSYSTYIVADKERFPTLLSNGDLVASGDLENGRHFVEWKDPHKKPCYLFALVAGDFAQLKDKFVTTSGREVDLYFYSDPARIDQCRFAMQSLIRAMKWDQDRFGREYDLDTYMVVVVDDFNGGAMENKGLNVFNTRCVLATPSMTTDAEYEKIEAVVGHEYFHNWTGNRVTLRDWFHLSLKEGLTVFRDQEFSSDLHSRGVVRLDTVQELWQRQFSEDAGPNAHAVRPTEALSVNNFFSATIYEKGAEVIRMIYAMTGTEGFRKGMDLYFTKYDGCAVTIEEFVACFEQTGGIDLTQFRLWYSTPGTPAVEIQRIDDETVEISQSCKSSKGAAKQPLHIPISFAQFNENGEMIEEGIYDLKDWSIRVPVKQAHTLSVLRSYSAPVTLKQNLSSKQRQLLIECESDTFQVWEQSQRLMLENNLSGDVEPIKSSISRLLTDKKHDDLFLSNILNLPSVNTIANAIGKFDSDEIFKIQMQMAGTLADVVDDHIAAAIAGLKDDVDKDYDSHVAARRALQLKIVRYAISAKNDSAIEFAREFIGCNNATVFLSLAFSLVHFDENSAVEVLEKMRQRMKSDGFMMNKYFELVATNPHDGALKRVHEEMGSNSFSWTSPNNVLFLIRDFANYNLRQFHKADGSGYDFLADSIIHLDPINAQTAARLCSGFSRLADLASDRKTKMNSAMARIAEKPGISPNVLDLTQVALVSSNANIGQSP